MLLACLPTWASQAPGGGAWCLNNLTGLARHFASVRQIGFLPTIRASPWLPRCHGQAIMMVPDGMNFFTINIPFSLHKHEFCLLTHACPVEAGEELTIICTSPLSSVDRTAVYTKLELAWRAIGLTHNIPSQRNFRF